MKLRDKILKFVCEHNDQLSQALNKEVLGEPYFHEEMSAVCRQVAAEGMVLLKNDGLLPLKKEKTTAFFGRVQRDWFYVGYGSGGDVNPPYRISPMAAMESRGDICYHRELAQTYAAWCKENVPYDGFWGMWPTHYDEMPLDAALVAKAARESETAVVFLGRAMGESMDNKLKKGCYYLADQEKQLLDRVTAAFQRVVVVIDAGNIIDLHWTKAYGSRIGAILYAFQGGMESGNAVVDVLYGERNPSGKLTDTIALRHQDYPAAKNFGGTLHNCYEEDIYVGYRYFETFLPGKVLYPFGFGLSYTTFCLESQYREENGKCCLDVTVTNTGKLPGGEVVQVYVNPPQGKLGKPLRNLVAFRKTDVIAPGESQVLHFAVDPVDFASYDDSGVTGHPYCYVLEVGSYGIYVGSDVRSAKQVAAWQQEELKVVRQLACRAGAVTEFHRIHPVLDKQDRWTPALEPVPQRTGDLKAHILENLPDAIPAPERAIQWEEVRRGEATLDEFAAQLTAEELDAITRGEGCMRSPLGTAGNAGILGGTTESLREKGVPVVTTTDGPSGLRISYSASLLPCGTALASTWNPALVEKLGRLFGEEMAHYGTDIILGPGMNIHRDPLCGRNFEYFSEDPYVSGKIAAAMVRGVQSNPGRSACPKHFACNNQEWMRSRNDSRLSERALREIYLKGFEICVRESDPLTIMTSYNKINGVWGHYQYELVTDILRGEWGYDGLVITDWWMQSCTDPNFPALKNDAYRVRSQVDVLMPGGKSHNNGKGDGSLLRSYAAPDGITLGEMQRCAKNVLQLCLKLGK